MKLLKWVLCLFAIAGALISSCNKPVVTPTSILSTPGAKVATAAYPPSPEFLSPTKLSTSVTGTSQVLLFDDWHHDGFPMDAAKITDLTLKKNILKIQVAYQGGCQEHTFELYAWTGFLMSNPPQAELYLSQDAHEDTCTEKVKKSLSFDLIPLDNSRTGRHAHPLILRIYEPAGGSFANEPFMPLLEWP